MKKTNSALYIHIPFCIKKCDYCDFASYEDYSLQDAYFNALEKELEIACDIWQGKTFDALFLGGGTPTSVKDEYLERILNVAHKKLDIKFKEATIEANPGTVDAQKLKFYLHMGLNRISFGMQAAQNDLLKAVGRIHDFDGARESVELAHKAGFSNINVDLMSGLPGQTKEDILESVVHTDKMGVSHISLYTLKLEEGTPLQYVVDGGKVFLPSKDDEYEMSEAARVSLSELGYYRYEISNYAKNESECLHNLHYWNNDDFLGVGLAAASGINGLRTTNTRDISQYVDMISKGEMPYADSAQSGNEEYAFETLMLGLRLTKGVNVVEYYIRHGIQIDKRCGELIKSLKDRSLITFNNDILTLTDRGMDIQNTVLVEFMEGFEF